MAEVHKLLQGSDLMISPSLPVTASATPMDAEGEVGEAMALGSDCVNDGIMHVAASGSGGPEVAGASEGLQILPQQALEGDDVTVVVEGSAEGSQSCVPPAKKLRREEGSGADCNREQVEVSEQGEEEEEHDNTDEFFISTSQINALRGLRSDQCNVLEVEEEEEEGGLTLQDNVWAAFSGSLESVPLCIQEVEEGDVQFVEDSPCSAPLVIDLMKDSVSPGHDHGPGMLHGDDESLVVKVTVVSDGGGVGEGDGKSDGQLTAQEDTGPEGVQGNKEEGGVGATVGVECDLAGHAEKDSGPLQSVDASCTAVQGKAGVGNEVKRDAKEEEAGFTEKGEVDDGMRVEVAMDVEESSGREYTENDSDFQTAPSEVEISSPQSNQDMCSPSDAFLAPGDKGVLQTTTTNTPVVVVDLVCEDTTPKTSEGHSDVSHISDSNKSSSAAYSQPGSRTMEGSEEAQNKFTIIVPERSEPSSVSAVEQDTAESSPVATQPFQNCTASSSPSFTLVTPEISPPAYQLPHSSCSSDTSLLTSTAPITSTTEGTGQKQKELLNKIMAYWRRRHMESPVSSDILCEFTASRDQQVQTSVPTPRRGTPRKHH